MALVLHCANSKKISSSKGLGEKKNVTASHSFLVCNCASALDKKISFFSS